MRTTTIKFCMFFTVLILNFGQIAYAENKVKIDEVIPPPTEIDVFTTSNERFNNSQLPDVTAPELVTVVIKYILRLAAMLTMIALIVTAIYYLISMGKEEDISKAKNIMIYLIIGIIIIAASYGIVTGLSQFDFFTEPSP